MCAAKMLRVGAAIALSFELAASITEETAEPEPPLVLPAKCGSFTGQFFQDRVLLDVLAVGGKGGWPSQGFYVDLAANHHYLGSNTYVLDRCYGWKGICVEPNPLYHHGIRTERLCELVPTCMMDHVAWMNFSFQGPVGKVGAGSQSLRCTTLSRVLPRHVDYMSLDIEGAELSALQGVDWEHTTIDVIQVENAGAPLVNFLQTKGYELMFCASLDAVFIRSAARGGTLIRRARKYQKHWESMVNRRVKSFMTQCSSGDVRRCATFNAATRPMPVLESAPSQVPSHSSFGRCVSWMRECCHTKGGYCLSGLSTRTKLRSCDFAAPHDVTRRSN
eukprot:TRINITY_DN6135_c0_g1_i1.p1 TRINITY_DN6135_c0_g1~~TRINITY_DN6135_c0_g1_i1.p1  ORF type:complete len:357 (+),score=23.44 TRINITY_DN6135_c0_g1_i1:75-1073(+)